MPKLSATTYLLLLLTLAVVGLAGVSYYQHTTISAKSDLIDRQDDALAKIQKDLADQLNRQVQNQEQILKLGESLNALSSDAQSIKLQLKSYESRKGTVLAKPELVEKRINAASDKVFDDISCASGRCKESK